MVPTAAKPGSPEVLLAIGRLDQQKNFGLLIDALTEFEPNVVCVY